MTYQQKNITVFLMNSILIFGYYMIHVVPMLQESALNSTAIFSLWATVIVLGIIATIIAIITTQILFGIIHRIKTGEDPTFVEDERDKLIELKGTKNAYTVFSTGVFISMITLVFGTEPLVMFNFLIVASFTGDIFGHLSRLYLYRRGF